MNTPNTNRFNDRDGDNRDGDTTQFREEWLSAYLDDELTAPQREIVEQRIAVDAETTLMLRDLERIRGLVSSLPGWPGQVLEVPLDGLSGPQLSDAELSDAELSDAELSDGELSDAEQPDTLQSEADFHDELQPLVEQVSLLGSTTMPSVKLPASAQAAARGSQGWWRPLAMVASLLFVVGLGVLLWPEAVPWSVATSTRVDDAPADSEGILPQSSITQPSMTQPSITQPSMSEGAASSAAAGSALESQSLPAEPLADTAAGTAADATTQDNPNRAATRALQPGGRGGAGNLAAGNSAAEPAADFSLQGNEMLRSPSLPDVENRRSEFAPAAQSLEALSSRAAGETGQAEMAAMGAAAPAAESALRSPSLEQVPPTLSKTAPAQPALQLAHSTAWQEAELSVGLARLAPLLNLAPAPQTQALLPDQSTRQTSPRGSDATIPVAMASLPPAATEVSQLAELLQQSGVSLTGNAATTAASNFDGVVPYGTVNAQTALTVALFVNRGQAEKILRAAQQSGQLSAPPVWIRSAASLEAASNDDQQVIVVLAPQ